jgi:hypothetical protein
MKYWFLLLVFCNSFISADFVLDPPNGRKCPLKVLDPIVFSSSEHEALVSFFQENGYVVVDCVSEAEHRDALVALMDRIMQKNIPLTRRLGFMDLYHDNTLAQLRQNPKLYEVFTYIFGTEKLWVVFDRVIHQLPNEEDDILNPHVDQNPLKNPQFSYAQAMLALRDMDETSGTLALVPKSHLFFDEYMAWAKPSDGYIENRGDRELPFVALRLKEGQIVIWDSRTTHSRFRTEPKNKRYAALLTFAPAKNDSALVELRLKYFHEGIGWYNHDAGLRATARPRCEQSLRETEEILTPLGEKLYGVTSWFKES